MLDQADVLDTREYLIARHVDSREVVGTCDILSAEAAQRSGGYALERQFDLGGLEVLRGRMVEMRRVCLHPEYRPESVMRLIGAALERYLIDARLDYVLASVCIGVEDGGHAAASIYQAACARSMSPDDCRVFPRCALPLGNLPVTLPADPPPLLRAYLELGAWICGEPAVDRKRAELPILLPLARMQGRYARHFLARAA
jgi:putative hemolysin